MGCTWSRSCQGKEGDPLGSFGRAGSVERNNANMTKYIVWGVTAVLACSQLNMEGQDWNSAGNFGLDPVNSFLGNTDGVPINFRTNNLRRMILTPTLTNQTVNGYGGLDLSGFLGIGTFNASILYWDQSAIQHAALGRQWDELVRLPAVDAGRHDGDARQ
jgi:hypothetical protein